MLPKVSLLDNSFVGDKCSSKYHSPSFFEYDRSEKIHPVVFFTDSCLSLVNLKRYKDSFKVAMLLEPPVIRSDHYRFCQENYSKFDVICSHWTDFLSQIPNGFHTPNVMSWISREDWGMHPKSIDISIIASNKNSAPGHQLRHKIIDVFKDKLDVSGYGYKPLKHKIEVLAPSRFHIVVENCDLDLYYSEKLCDSILTYSVPIFFGSNRVKEHFDEKGMFFFKTLNKLNDIIKEIKKDPEGVYNNKSQYLTLNYDKLLALGVSQEDYISERILKPKGLL